MAKRRRERPTVKSTRASGRVIEIGAQGDGVIEVDGKTAFAPYTAPGDEGLFEIAGERATLLELQQASEKRRDPPCRHYGVCGGCSLQHVALDYYREWKRTRVAEALSRVDLGDVIIRDVVETPVSSRRRAVFSVQKRNQKTTIGFNKKRSSEITSVSDCVVLRPDLRAALPHIVGLADAVPVDAFDFAVTACANGIDVDIRSRRFRDPSSKEYLALSTKAAGLPLVRVSLNGESVLQKETPFVEMGRVRVSPPPGGFMQASDEGEAAIAELVSTIIGNSKRVADLFCGAGAFALRLGEARQVFGADTDGPSLAAMRAAAGEGARAGVFLHEIKCEARNLDERPLMADELSAFDAIVIDPPRAGAARQSEELAKSDVPVIASVSCNPSTFARDARTLVNGGYELEAVTPVDQFVFSAHIEVVAAFRRPLISRLKCNCSKRVIPIETPVR